MSLFNELQEQGINQLLVRRLGMPGVSAPAPTLSPEVFPVFTVEGERPEHAFLKGERLLSAQGAVSAVAAQVSRMVLWNPPGSGTLAIVERVEVEYNTGGLFLLSVGEVTTVPTLSTQPPQVARDSRWNIGTGGLRGAGICQVHAGASAGSVTNNIAYARTVGSGVPFALELPFVVSPGFALELHLGTVNIALNRGSIVWRERIAGTGELR